MYCIGYSDTLTMSVPLQVLKSLAADFDGDGSKLIVSRRYTTSTIVFTRNSAYMGNL